MKTNKQKRGENNLVNRLMVIHNKIPLKIQPWWLSGLTQIQVGNTVTLVPSSNPAQDTHTLPYYIELLVSC